MIDGVIVYPLKLHVDERGRLMVILRNDDAVFEKFGQVYMTAVNPGYVKAWHYHRLQTDHFACVKGNLRVGLYDARENSKTYGESQEVILNLKEPKLLKIPPLVYHGFESVDEEEAIVINIPTEHYDNQKPDEFRIDPFDKNIPFTWINKKGG